MPGPRPLPTVVKLFNGNPGKRAPLRDEPKPEQPLLVPPADLTAPQKRLWLKVIAGAPPGLLTSLDESVLVAWLVAYDTHRRCRLHIRRSLTDRTSNGTVVQSPHVQIMNKQAMIMLRASAALGFDPAARSRISVTPRKPAAPLGPDEPDA